MELFIREARGAAIFIRSLRCLITAGASQKSRGRDDDSGRDADMFFRILVSFQSKSLRLFSICVHV